MARIGWLSMAASNDDLLSGFRPGLEQLGYIEGQNIAIDYRFADGLTDRLETQALELVRLKVDAIVATGSQAVEAAKRATSTIPIVMVAVGDPVGLGLVASLNKPGGNITGLSYAQADTAAKWLEYLHDVVPKATRVGYLEDMSAPVSRSFVREVQRAAHTLGVAVTVYPVTRPADVAPQLDAMARDRVQAFVVSPSAVPRTRQEEIVAFAAAQRLPAMYVGRDYVDAGGLMSYNASRRDIARQGAIYVVKILNGARPAELPVQQPARFELVINLKTAKALGLTVPQELLLRADEVIQ
jgi:putative ABC transport system substrate-binding protein